MVRAGQVWRDGDKRMYNRLVRVVTVERVPPRNFHHSFDEYATCAILASGCGRTTRIRTDRMDGRRWVLVKDVQP